MSRRLMQIVKTGQGLLGVLLVLSLTLSGCSDESTRNKLDHDSQESREGLDKAAHPGPEKHYNPLVVSDKVWTGNTALRMQRGVPLPPKYETAHGITLVSNDTMSLSAIADVISMQTGIPIRLGSLATGSAAPSNASMPPPMAGMPPSAGAATSGAASGSSMHIAYEGPLSGLLDRISSYFGVSWHYDGTSLSINKFSTRTFTIEALPGSQSISEGMQDDTGGGGSATGGSSGGSSAITQNSKFSLDIKYWDELTQVLTAMLNGNGSVTISPSIGTVTVTTTPDMMRQIAEYLAHENQKLSRQIAINVEVYNVDLQEGMSFDIAFSTALKKLTDNLSVNVSQAVGIPAVPSTGTNIPFTSAGTLTAAVLGSNGNKATDIFSALSSIGDTSKVAKFPLITLNNRPASRRIGQDIAYLAQSSTTPVVTGSTGSTTTNPSSTLSPGTVHQGFTVQATPRLLDDGRILLQYSLSIIDLVVMNSFASNGSTIQLPTTSNRIFVQQAVLKSGSTLILGGAEEQDTGVNSQGVGDPYNYLLGGGSSSGKTHSMVFYALTPQVLETPHSEQD